MTKNRGTYLAALDSGDAELLETMASENEQETAEYLGDLICIAGFGSNHPRAIEHERRAKARIVEPKTNEESKG